RTCRGETPLPQRLLTRNLFLATVGKTIRIVMNRIHRELLAMAKIASWFFSADAFPIILR
ncbi:MAG: hypothetical protein PVI89_18070, partial [Desulfobacteraceae bacterium]